MTTHETVLAKMIDGRWWINDNEINDREDFLKIDHTSFLTMSDYNLNLLKKHNVTHVQIMNDSILMFEDFVRFVKIADSNQGS